MRLHESKEKPIEVLAIHYNHNIILDEFLKLLSSNKDEPVRYDEITKTIYIQKERGEIALTYGNWVIYEENTDKCFWAIQDDIFKETYYRIPNTTNSYVKKVYEVKCIPFKSLESKDIIDVLNFIGLTTEGKPLNILQRDELVEEVQEQGYIIINTLEGAEKLNPTEILIRGIKGEYYPVTLENFNTVYEVVEE